MTEGGVALEGEKVKLEGKRVRVLLRIEQATL
jgi:hypothetical protein